MSEITKPADIESAIEKFSDSQVTPYIKPYDFERQVANDFKSKRGRRIGRVVLGSAAAALVAV
ncbi:MAG TPA: hypothetical protein VLF63_03235, partial [Patescibacteria group bacterium]|nr:hypothetical protein [Patescibacteria group bacterium]